MANLNAKIGEMNYDGLVSDIQPKVIVSGGTIAKCTAETTYKRGTLFAKSSSTGKLVIFGTEAGEEETLSADCILCDDVTVGTVADVTVPVYISGCFNPDKVIMAEDTSLAEADKDVLRTKNIIFKAASAAN